MTLKATSTPAGTTKSASRTSTSHTSAPRLRKAAATPAPEASETGRSDPGPPMSTAMRLPLRSGLFFVASSICNLLFSNNLNFSLKPDTAF